jgi:rubrerythrin
VAAAPAFAQAQYGQIERGVSEEVGATAVEPVSEDGFIAFRAAGEQATGDYRCSQCGYGVSVRRTLPMCPMCGGGTWESWRP